MKLIALGTNHKFCPIGIREKLSFSKKELPRALAELMGYPGINAAVIISTCNRTELYASVADIEDGIKSLKDFLRHYHQLDLVELAVYLYLYIGKEAVKHLFSVAAGLDSQLIGEPQILGQVEAAYQLARNVEATDQPLDLLFSQAIKVGSKVRTQTAISYGGITLASIVLDLIKSKYACLKDKQILIIGLGKIAESIAEYLSKEEIKAVFISNRNYEKAKSLAQTFGLEAVKFEQLKEKLTAADILISVTNSPHLILKKEDCVNIKKPLLIIDLALPRDIEEQVKFLDGVQLFCLDDLNLFIEDKLSKRRQAIPKAQEIIKNEVEDLWLKENLELAAAGAPSP